MRAAAALLPLLLAWPAAGQAPPGRRPGLVDVDVDGSDLAGVVTRLARLGRASVIVDPSVTEPVTASLREVPWRDALTLLVRQAGCELVELEGGVLLVRRPDAVSARFTGAGVRSVLRRLVQGTGTTLAFAPGVRGRVTVDLDLVPSARALDAVAAAAGLHLQRRGPDLLVVSDRPLPPAAAPPRAPRLEGPRVDVDLDGEPLGSVAAQLAAVARARIEVAPASGDEPRVSVSLTDVPWRVALDAIALVTRARVEERADGSVLLVRPAATSFVADGAPAAAWFQMLAEAAGVTLAGDAPAGAIECDLRGLEPLAALELTAELHGFGLERAGDELRLRAPAEPPAPPPLADPRLDATLEEIERLARAGDAAGLEPRLRRLLAAVERRPWPPAAPPPPLPAAARAELDALLDGAIIQADRRQVEELLKSLVDLRALLGREGPPAIEAARAALRARAPRLVDLREVELTLRLNLDVAEGEALVEAMRGRLRDGDHAAVLAGKESIGDLCERMRAEEQATFHRRAEALYLEAKAVADESAARARAARAPLAVTATLCAPGRSRAIVNGRIVAQGDAVLDAAGAAVRDYRVSRILPDHVRFEVERLWVVRREVGAR